MKIITEKIGSLPLKIKLWFSFILLVFFPIVILAIFNYQSTSNILSEEVIMSSKKSFEQSYGYLETRMQTISRDSAMAVLDEFFQVTVMLDSEILAKDPVVLKESSDTLKSFLYRRENRNSIEEINVFIDDESPLSRNQDKLYNMSLVENAEWYRKLNSINNYYCWISTKDMEGDETAKHSQDGRLKETLALVRRVPDLKNDYRNSIAYIRCEFSVHAIRKLLQDASNIQNSYSFIMDSKGYLVLSSLEDENQLLDMESFVFTDLQYFQTSWLSWESGNEEWMLGARQVADSDWYMFTAIPIKQIISQGSPLLLGSLIAAILLGIVSIIFSFSISGSITKRLVLLTQHMQDFRNNHPRPIENSVSGDEIGRLIEDYNFMIQRMQQITGEQIESAKALQSEKLKLLQAQINPHFLYNTLDMINFYGRNKDIPEITIIIQALTRFFRISLSDGRDIIPIRDELSHVSQYIILQNLRYENAIHFTCDVPDLVQNCMIPKLTLQPIIENAIQHGVLCRKERKGRISIFSEYSKDDIFIHICNDGPTIDQQIVRELNEGSFKPPEKGSGYGISNVKERIKLMYGRTYGIEIYSSKEGWNTKISIHIPRFQDEDKI